MNNNSYYENTPLENNIQLLAKINQDH